jgi:hypothetical protein
MNSFSCPPAPHVFFARECDIPFAQEGIFDWLPSQHQPGSGDTNRTMRHFHLRRMEIDQRASLKD